MINPHEIIEHLNGTCKSTDEAAQAFGVEEEEVLKAIIETQQIECCTDCSWWCEFDELCDESGQYICLDCKDNG